MKRTVLVILLAFACGEMFGWGNATHVYFANQFGVSHGGANFHEMYGALLVDAFNTKLDSMGVFMADRTHHEFMSLYRATWWCDLKAVGFGFVSHNDTWGADFTAHHAARTLRGGGYAVVKGAELAPLLVPDIVSILLAAGLDPPTAQYIAEALAPEFGHDLIETAVDLMIKRNQDPSIGRKMVVAAMSRPLDTPLLLSAAYARPLSQYARIPLPQAARYIVNAEREYRQQLIQYGGIFTLSETDAIQALAQLNAQIAQGYLEFYAGVPVTVDPAVVAGFIASAVSVAGPTYAAEIAATSDYVAQQLHSHGIRSCGSFFGKEEASGGDGNAGITPAGFAFKENYPNPFNPSTTITFAVPAQAPVTLEIYNVLGQRVRTLADSKIYEAGIQSEVWDGKDDHGLIVPSGTYLSRLLTPDGVFTRKMLMMK